MPVAPASTPDLIDLIRRSGITAPALDPADLPADAQKAAGVLVKRGVITRFQAQQLLLGRHKGFRLGAYAILEQVGRGGMGVVYLAEHQELRRKVAIKVLVVNRDEDARLAAERFFREARAAAALDHPNIVRIFDVCRHGDTPYLVMEYVEGETLQQTLDREGALPYTAAADAVAQAAAGLQHAHEKGFVHRDIKPGNLMRDKAGVVKILDMGLARTTTAEDQLTERLDAGAVVGTADFIAPEQALNSPHVDVRADIYSLGATFFSLVTGKPPFAGNTTQKLLQHQMAAAPNVSAIDATLPKGLAGVVAKMLAKKPQERYQTPAEVIAALAPWLGDSPRVLAGISRTSLAAEAELRARLQESAGGTGRPRRPGEDAVSDSGVVNPVDPAAETGAVASSLTARSEQPHCDDKPKAIRKRRVTQIVAAGAAVVAFLVGIGFALGAFDGGPAREQVQAPPASENSSEPPKPAPPPLKVEPPKAARKKAEPVPQAAEPVAYRLELAGLPPFTTRGKSEGSGVKARDLKFVPTAKSGDGGFPPGWTGETWDKAGEAEFSIGVHAGRPALAARNLAKATAFLISPDVTFQTPAARVRFQYLTRSTAARAALIKFKVPGLDNKTGLAEVAQLAGTSGAWRAVELTVPLRGYRTVFFEWHSLETGSEAGLYLGGFEASDAVESGEAVFAKYDFAGQAPFAIRSDLELKADGSKVGRQLSRTGSGEQPLGWSARCWNKDSQMEYFADAAGAIGIRTVRGPASAMLFSPRIPTLTPLSRVRVDYSAGGKEASFTIKFKPDDARLAWEVARVPATPGGGWKTADYVIDLKGATAGLFEFHNGDPSPDAPVRLRTVTVTQPPPGTPPTPGTTTTAAAPPAFAGWVEGPLVYRFDAASVPAFRVTKDGGTVRGGVPEQLPRGVSARCWKKEAAGEFRRDEADGAAALGVTNLSDAKSGQLAFELERDLGLTLRTGAVYRVKLSYLTRNEAVGTLVVQTTDYKGVASTRLDGPPAGWKSATLAFERKDAAPVRVTIDNNAVGEGNVLYVRTVELFELLPPK